MTAVRASTRQSTLGRRRDLAASLIDIAERQIAGAGLASLRARSLAEAANCAVGAIYGVFPDLDELILLVNQRTLDAIETALGLAVPSSSASGYLVQLADAYLDYASANRRRWEALFQHRMAGDRPAPDWYVTRRHHAFHPLAGPLAELCPLQTELEREAMARSLFAAVHGVVAMGLDEMLGPTTLPALRHQLALVVSALATGLPASATMRVAAT